MKRAHYKKAVSLVILSISIQLFGTKVIAKEFKVRDYQIIDDIRNLPQSANWLANNIKQCKQSNDNLNALASAFNKQFFAAWQINKDELINLRTSFEERQKRQGCYAENYLPWREDYLSVIDKIDYQKLDVQELGIIIKNTDLRLLPTIHPCYSDPQKAGEGYPFDNLQDAMLYIGSPIKIINYTKDGSWVLVKTNFGNTGWVKASEVGKISDQQKEIYSSKTLGVILKDATPLTINGNFIESLKLGTILPVINLEKGKKVLVPARDDQGGINFILMDVPSGTIKSLPLKYNKDNVIESANKLLGQTYGWGNLNGNRDCSAFTKDFYSLFGYFLPRDSALQAREGGEFISLKDMTLDQKITLLKERAEPFSSMLYFPGHIMIYVGSKDNEIYLMHSIWGVKTSQGDQVGRNIIGKAVITTQHPGKEIKYVAKNANLLSRATGFININICK